VKVSEKTYKKLNRVAGTLHSRLGRPVSVDEALEFVLKQAEKKKSSASDFAGSWSYMSDKEEAEILGSLEKFWKGWQKPRKE
jgi:hypothetical protein